MFILSDSIPVKMFTIILCAFVYLCSTIGLSVYKNWSVLLVESIFIANIVVLSAVVLASKYSNAMSPISEQSGDAMISIGITSAIMFLAVIVIHHRLRKIQPCIKFWRNVSTINSGETAPLLKHVASYNNRSYGSEYREPLLEDK